MKELVNKICNERNQELYWAFEEREIFLKSAKKIIEGITEMYQSDLEASDNNPEDLQDLISQKYMGIIARKLKSVSEGIAFQKGLMQEKDSFLDYEQKEYDALFFEVINYLKKLDFDLDEGKPCPS